MCHNMRVTNRRKVLTKNTQNFGKIEQLRKQKKKKIHVIVFFFSPIKGFHLACKNE